MKTKRFATCIASALLLASCSVHAGVEHKEVEKKPGAGEEKVHEDIHTEPEIEMVEEPVVVAQQDISNIQFDVFRQNERLTKYPTDTQQYFKGNYSDLNGILTFRGNPMRNAPSFGTVPDGASALEMRWEFQTGSRSWGGGAGWTGQASIIEWEKDVREMMNLKEAFKTKDGFTEVVYASLDGRIYFLDVETGEKTREVIDIQNPIKGSVALDPRGYPLLYVGQGIPEVGNIGYRIYSLIDGELLAFIPGLDGHAYRGWGAFDGAPLINKETDTMILGGENGMVYKVHLQTEFDRVKQRITVSPEIDKYRYQIDGNWNQGIENSVAVYRQIAYFADNGGSVQALDLMTMKPIWAKEGTDDTDATIVIEEENGVPYLYTGTEVDKQGSSGDSILRKINGLTGEVVWEKRYQAQSLIGSDPVNGGMLATPVLGKGEIKGDVIFTIARVGGFNSGIIVSLDGETGEENWKLEMDHYAWSSPVDVYEKSGKAYLIQGDSVGNLFLFDAKTGKTVDTISLGSNIEASPIVYENHIIVGSRGGKFFNINVD